MEEFNHPQRFHMKMSKCLRPRVPGKIVAAAYGGQLLCFIDWLVYFFNQPTAEQRSKRRLLQRHNWFLGFWGRRQRRLWLLPCDPEESHSLRLKMSATDRPVEQSASTSWKRIRGDFEPTKQHFFWIKSSLHHFSLVLEEFYLLHRGQLPLPKLTKVNIYIRIRHDGYKRA